VWLTDISNAISHGPKKPVSPTDSPDEADFYSTGNICRSSIPHPPCREAITTAARRQSWAELHRNRLSLLRWLAATVER
jgi:hypothetical protein